MHFDIIFKGTPANFMEMVRIFMIDRTYHETNDEYVWIAYNTIFPTAKPIPQILLYHNNPRWRTLAFIHAQDGPANQALLKAHFPEKEWADYKPSAQIMFDEMARQGWIDNEALPLEFHETGVSIIQVSDQNNIIERSKKRGGRKITKDKAELFKQVKNHNRNLSYAGVAMKATMQEKQRMQETLANEDEFPRKLDEVQKDVDHRFLEKWGKEEFAPYDVRNAYNAMGWNWEKSSENR
jgi:hypothetical protein